MAWLQTWGFREPLDNGRATEARTHMLTPRTDNGGCLCTAGGRTEVGWFGLETIQDGSPATRTEVGLECRFDGVRVC